MIGAKRRLRARAGLGLRHGFLRMLQTGSRVAASAFKSTTKLCEDGAMVVRAARMHRRRALSVPPRSRRRRRSRSSCRASIAAADEAAWRLDATRTTAQFTGNDAAQARSRVPRHLAVARADRRRLARRLHAPAARDAGAGRARGSVQGRGRAEQSRACCRSAPGEASPGCCLVRAGYDARVAPIANLGAKAPDDWSRALAGPPARDQRMRRERRRARAGGRRRHARAAGTVRVRLVETSGAVECTVDASGAGAYRRQRRGRRAASRPAVLSRARAASRRRVRQARARAAARQRRGLPPLRAMLRCARDRRSGGDGRACAGAADRRPSSPRTRACSRPPPKATPQGDREARGAGRERQRQGSARAARRCTSRRSRSSARRCARWLRAGADPNALDGDRYDMVTIAAVANDPPRWRRRSRIGNRATNVTSRYDGTALIAAAHLGHVDVVRILIRAGAPLDHVNNLGWTALIESIVLGDGGPRHTATLAALVDAGAERQHRRPQRRHAAPSCAKQRLSDMAELLLQIRRPTDYGKPLICRRRRASAPPSARYCAHDYDIGIVGAGFAGLACARAAARRGLRVLVIDRKPAPGESMHTTGLVVKEAAERWEIPAALTRRVQRHPPLFAVAVAALDLDSAGYYFLATDTPALMRWFAREASRAGAHLRFGRPYRGATRIEGGMRLADSGERVRYLVGADGPRSAVAARRSASGPTASSCRVSRPSTSTSAASTRTGCTASSTAPSRAGTSAGSCPATTDSSRSALRVDSRARPDLPAFLRKLAPVFDFTHARCIGRRGGLDPCRRSRDADGGGQTSCWSATPPASCRRCRPAASIPRSSPASSAAHAIADHLLEGGERPAQALARDDAELRVEAHAARALRPRRARRACSTPRCRRARSRHSRARCTSTIADCDRRRAGAISRRRCCAGQP